MKLCSASAAGIRVETASCLLRACLGVDWGLTHPDKEPCVASVCTRKHKLLSVSRSRVGNVRGACLQNARGARAREAFVHRLVATYQHP